MANLGPQFIKNSYQDLVQITASNALAKGDGTSISNISVTASWAQSASNAVNAQTASFLSGAFLQGGNSFGATALLGTNDTQDLQFETSGSVRMTISSSGNVGIGTTTPASRLQVSLPSNTSNQSIFRSDAGDNLLAINTFPTTNRMQLLLGDYNGTATPNLAAISDSNTGIQWAGSDIIRFVNGGSENVTINASGNVGIGTTTPQRRLHVDASGSANTDIPLLLTSVDANNRVGIRFASSSLSAGRQHSLFNRVSTPTAEWLLGTNAGETAQWNFIPRDDTNYAITLRTPFNGGTAQITTGLSQSLFSLGAGGTGNQHLNISSSGRVGIGTTTPSTTLQVAGTSSLQNIVFDTHNTYDIGTSAVRVRTIWSNGSIVAVSGFFNNQTIYNSVSLGPGDFTPTARLHISGSNSEQMMRINSPTNANILFVSGSGRVGVGTSNPLSLLHISASSGNEFLRITSGSQNILNIRSGSVVFFAGTGVAPNSGVDLDIQGTGAANGGSVRFAANGSSWGFGSVSSVNRGSTGNPDMFNVTMGGTSATLIQNPMKIQFDANQSSTGGGGYTVLRLNATHASTAGTGSKLLQTWEFAGVQRSVVNITGSIGVGITTPSASVHISSSLGLAPILAITPHHPLPTTNIPTGSFMVSSSIPPKPFFWDGTTWNALY